MHAVAHAANAKTRVFHVLWIAIFLYAFAYVTYLINLSTQRYFDRPILTIWLRLLVPVRSDMTKLQTGKVYFP